jgi:aspartyl protease family protein
MGAGHCKEHSGEGRARRIAIWLVLSAMWWWGWAAHAAQVALVGLFPGKAVLVIDGTAPRTVAVGQVSQGVRVVAVDRDSATIEADGRTARVMLGTPVSVSVGGDQPASLTIVSNANGHFIANGSINGASTRFLVDTGASTVAMSPRMARTAGVDYLKGSPGVVSTANGNVAVWNVRLERLSLGDIALTDVDATVVQTDMPYALLGMSVLNRMEMRREGSTLVLKRRY